MARCEALQRERGGEGGERCVVVREDVPAQRGDPGLHRGQRIAAACEEHLPERIVRSEEHTSELQSLMRISYAVFCLKKKKNKRKRATRQLITNYRTL